MADESSIAQLIFKLLCQGLSTSERERLDKWVEENSANQALLERMLREENLVAGLPMLKDFDEEALDAEIEYWKGAKLVERNASAEPTNADRLLHVEKNQETLEGKGFEQNELEEKVFHPLDIVTEAEKPVFIQRKAWWLGAAAAVMVIALSTIFYLHDKQDRTEKGLPVIASMRPGITVGEYGTWNKAIITLGDGRVVELDTVAIGSAVTSDGSVIKGDNNTVVFESNAANADGTNGGPAAENKLYIPSGSIYKVQLPDGSKAILNGNSSLRWRGNLDGADRVVMLDGEGYFEVVKDKSKPFHVKSSRQDAEAVGTAFNVRDYSNEPQQETTLETGKLIVHNVKGTVTLKPLQMAVASENKFKIDVRSDVNMDNVLMWKKNFFNFDGQDMRTALWKIAQNYGKVAVFQKGLPSQEMGKGDFQRDLPLDTLLVDLQLQELHFDIKDDTIFVKRSQ